MAWSSKEAWHRLFKGRDRFLPREIQKGLQPVNNPGRGWYRLFSFDIGEEINWEQWKGSLNLEDSLVLVMADIGRARDRLLDTGELAQLREVFSFFVQQGKDLIVRIVYDREGFGLRREPGDISLILEHMKQIGPVLAQYADSILVVQGMFVGSWGEMHDSKYLSRKDLRLLANTLWTATDKRCVFAVRRPVQWRMLCGRENSISMQIGLFDDGIFGSDTHLGTFGLSEKEKWCEPWSAKNELEFEKQQMQRTLNGGEALFGESIEAHEIIDRLRSMHLCYLNEDYEQKRLEQWKSLYVEEKGCYGQSLYEYVSQHMGYCFVVQNAIIKREHDKNSRVKSGISFVVTAEIDNRGFGNLCQKAHCILEFRMEKRLLTQTILETDPRTWDSQTMTTISGRIRLPDIDSKQEPEIRSKTEKKEQERIGLYLLIRRVQDDKMICFANADSESGVCLGFFLP